MLSNRTTLSRTRNDAVGMAHKPPRGADPL